MNLSQIERLATRLVGSKTVLFCAVIVLVLIGLVASRQSEPTRISIIVGYASVTAGTWVLATLSLVHWFAVPRASPALSLYRRMIRPGQVYAVVSTLFLAAQAVLATIFSYSMLSMLP